VAHDSRALHPPIGEDDHYEPDAATDHSVGDATSSTSSDVVEPATCCSFETTNPDPHPPPLPLATSALRHSRSRQSRFAVSDYLSPW
jgi:hypothetical protein